MALSEQARIAAALEAVGAAGAVTVTVAAVPVYDPAMELAEAWGSSGADLIAAAFEPQVDEEQLRAALERGDRAWVKKTLAGGLERALGPVLQAHAIRAAAAGYAATLAAWGAPEAHAAIALPPKLVQWISKAIASELKGLVSGGKQAVRQAVQAAVAKGGVSNATVKAVRQSIALTAKQTKALERFRAAQKADGLKGKRLDAAVRAEAKRMLDERARFIAEEETAKAMAMAQRVAWGALAQTGRINKKWLKLWVTMRDKDVCVVCEDLDGETAPLDGLFDDEFYGPPEPHKRCRCRLMLVAPDGKRERHAGGNDTGHPFWGNQHTGGQGGGPRLEEGRIGLAKGKVRAVLDEPGEKFPLASSWHDSPDAAHAELKQRFDEREAGRAGAQRASAAKDKLMRGDTLTPEELDHALPRTPHTGEIVQLLRDYGMKASAAKEAALKIPHGTDSSGNRRYSRDDVVKALAAIGRTLERHHEIIEYVFPGNPWHVEKRRGRFLVVQSLSGKVVGDHDTLARATAQIRALHANVPEGHAGGNDPGHPFWGNQYTDGAGGSSEKTDSTLKSAAPEAITTLGGGVNPTYAVTLDGGQKAVWKQIPNYEVVREVGAVKVAREVGMGDLVGGAVERGLTLDEIKNLDLPDELAHTRARDLAVGVMTEHHEGANALASENPWGASTDDVMRAAVFDAITEATDRHPGNWRVGQDGKLRLIDHGGHFTEGHGMSLLEDWAHTYGGNRDVSAYVRPFIEKAGALKVMLEEAGVEIHGTRTFAQRLEALKGAIESGTLTFADLTRITGRAGMRIGAEDRLKRFAQRVAKGAKQVRAEIEYEDKTPTRAQILAADAEAKAAAARRRG